MTVHGFRIFSVGYLFSGINIYASSFLRRCVTDLFLHFCLLQELCFSGEEWLYYFQCFWDWMEYGGAIIVAEVLGLTGSVSCLVKNKKKYHYY